MGSHDDNNGFGLSVAIPLLMEKIEKEVRKLCDVGFIKEGKTSSWLG